jgi:hypothetical protein
MDIKEIIQIFGLPEDASEEDVRTALKAGAQAIGDLAAERARAESSEDDAKSARDDKEKLEVELENEKKAHKATADALANEKAVRADTALDAAVRERRIGETGMRKLSPDGERTSEPEPPNESSHSRRIPSSIQPAAESGAAETKYCCHGLVFEMRNVLCQTSAGAPCGSSAANASAVIIKAMRSVAMDASTKTVVVDFMPAHPLRLKIPEYPARPFGNSPRCAARRA